MDAHPTAAETGQRTWFACQRRPERPPKLELRNVQIMNVRLFSRCFYVGRTLQGGPGRINPVRMSTAESTGSTSGWPQKNFLKTRQTGCPDFNEPKSHPVGTWGKHSTKKVNLCGYFLITTRQITADVERVRRPASVTNERQDWFIWVRTVC